MMPQAKMYPVPKGDLRVGAAVDKKSIAIAKNTLVAIGGDKEKSK